MKDQIIPWEPASTPSLRYVGKEASPPAPTITLSIAPAMTMQPIVTGGPLFPAPVRFDVAGPVPLTSSGARKEEGAEARWMTVPFPATVQFEKGRTYWLVLQSIDDEAGWNVARERGKMGNATNAGRRPPLASWVNGLKGFHNVVHHEQPRTWPSAVLYRFESALVFFNAPYFKKRVLEVAASRPGIKWFVVDGGPINIIDSTGAAMLEALAGDLRARDPHRLRQPPH
jgi:STAS domain